MTGQAFDRVIDKLAGNGAKLRMTSEGRASAQCPAHNDGTPSLSVTRIEGSVLLYCHGGCDTAQVLDKLGLAKHDLYDDPRGVSYDYADRQGTVVRTVTRTPDKRFSQSGITGRPTLYRLPEVAQALAEGKVIYLVEGEKDVHALESIGLVATTAPMGADSFSKVDTTPLHGANVTAVVDNDNAGQKWAAQVRDKLDGQCQSLRFVQSADGKDAADHIAAGHGANDLVPLDQDETPAERAKRLFPRLDWHALWADDEEEEWIHDPLLPARRSVVIYSPPKVGKSLLMLEMAVAISRGETFLGYTGRQVRVLYVDFENDPRGDVRSRLQAMGYGPADLDGLDYLSYPTLAGLDTERGALELLEAVKAYSSEVVVIDTVSRAVDGEENSNDTWLAMYRHTGLALKRAGVAIIRLDHSGKVEAKGTRGGSAKSGDVDAIWKLTKVTDDRFRLECTESRMSIDTKALLITRHTTPRLHHSVNAISAVTDFQAKVNSLIALLDTNGIPTSANRDTVRDFASSRGTKASGRVVQEVVKRRKNAVTAELLPEFTPLEVDPEPDQEFTPLTDPPKQPDLSTDHLNSGPRVQQSSPPPRNY
jgi:AAA domain/Toprim domain